MDVECPMSRSLKQCLRQDQAVGGYHQSVRSGRTDALELAEALEARGLKHFDAACGGKTLHRTRDRPQTTPGRTIGLG